MAPSSKCLTCGLCNFTPRLIITSDALNERLRSDYGGAAIAAAAELEIRLLSSQQQHLKEYESKLRSLVSPIRKLPNEIMLIIFDLVSQNNRMREDPGSEDSPLWPDDEDGLTVKPALSS
ncbi:hypothetical protein BT96DRAFT_1002891 [Gymnopus androsaceus JB14]|uniref:F-box domain-containing protein n=1 Tax=Gymnopus androsaceus JB14 TaxID=1447944 RepID=A0A6A4GVK8_9AGAR|nr:hypothetical protein BT96DRAFT_1002891 [Gymnopus androsaceus JB14]